MKHILWREFYKFFHNRKILLLCVCLLLFSLYAYSISVGREVRQVYLWEEPLEDKVENWRMASELTNAVKPYGGEANVIMGYLWMTEDTMSLFDGYFGTPDQEEFGAYWKYTFTVMDSTAIAYSAIIFVVFFFGMDFAGRGYNGAIYAGEDRRKTFLGKYIVFLALMLGLSLAEMLLATLLYNREIVRLSAGYVLKGVGLRLLKDLGVAAMHLIVPFLCKDEIKSLVLGFAFSLFFFSTRAIVNLYPYQFITQDFWKTMSDGRMIAGMVLVSVGLVAGMGILCGKLFERAELK